MKNILHEVGSRVTVSVGVTSRVPESLDGAEEFLHQAKEAGRNQVVLVDIK